MPILQTDPMARFAGDWESNYRPNWDQRSSSSQQTVTSLRISYAGTLNDDNAPDDKMNSWDNEHLDDYVTTRAASEV